MNFATPEWIPFGVESDERYRLIGRASVFSMVRLLFTILHYTASTSVKNIQLLKYTKAILDEELTARPRLVSIGIRSVSHIVKMPSNSFEIVDKVAMDYDDRRICCVCKCVCVFSAIACECNNSRVACTRHEQYMCKCAKTKKFLLEWASDDELKVLKSKIDSLARYKAYTREKQEQLQSSTTTSTDVGLP